MKNIYGDTLRCEPVRIENSTPIEYRLMNRRGVILLQGCFHWEEGSDHGFEWRDIPTEKED